MTLTGVLRMGTEMSKGGEASRGTYYWMLGVSLQRCKQRVQMKEKESKEWEEPGKSVPHQVFR